MTPDNLAQSGPGRVDLLQGLRVGISGAVPEEQYWKRPNQNEQILAFVGLLSDLVMKYGGRVVHGNHPSFTPIIMGRANKHFGPRADGKSATAHPHLPPVTLVASELWPLTWEFPLLPQVVDVIQTPRFGPGDVTDAETRNKSLTALRLVLIGKVDIVIAVGGKLHRGIGFNPGVLEELTIAQWHQVPCIIVAGYGGMAGEMDRDMILQFCSESGLDDEEKERMASTDQEIDLCVGGIVAHLARLVLEWQRKAPRRRELVAIPMREPYQAGDAKIRVAEVTEPMVDIAGKQFAEVVKAMEASNIDRIQELLSNPPSLVEQEEGSSSGDFGQPYLTFTGLDPNSPDAEAISRGRRAGKEMIPDWVRELAGSHERLSIRGLVNKVERDLTESLPLSDADRIRIYRDTGEALKQYLVERLREAKVAPHGTAADRGEPARIFLDLSTLQIGSSTTPGEPLRGTTLPGGFDLRLMYSESDVSSIPTSGTNLVIVADVKGVLYFRIFGADGKVVVDTDETRLTTQAGPIADLKRRLDSVRPPHELTRSEKDRVVTAVTSIVDHTLPGHYLEGHRLSRWVENLDKMHSVSDDLYDVVLLRILTAREVPEIREIYNKTGRTGKDPGTLLKDAFALLAILD